MLYLWTDDGTFVNLALVEGGFAEAIRVGANDSWYDELKGAERDADSAGLGMWGC
ncbi:thermonuclease family protein [Pseudolysinimonas sp.]